LSIDSKVYSTRHGFKMAVLNAFSLYSFFLQAEALFSGLQDLYSEYNLTLFYY